MRMPTEKEIKKAAKELLTWCQGSPDLTARDLANEYLREKDYYKYNLYWGVYEYLKEENEDYYEHGEAPATWDSDPGL